MNSNKEIITLPPSIT